MHLMAQVFLSLISSTFIVIHERFSLSSFSTFYFDLSFTILSHFSLLVHFEQHTELDNLITMQNLRTSANKGSNDVYDVHTYLTGYEPNDMVFNELNDSSVPFSYITQSSDLDIDDATLGKLLTGAHREHADYCDSEGVSVSQSSLSVVFDRTGKPVGERDVDLSVHFEVTRNTYSARSKFSENTQAEKVADRSRKPEERNSSNAQIRTLLDEQRQMIVDEHCEKLVITNSKQLESKKNAEFYEKNYGVSKWIPRGWIQGNIKIGPVLEVATCYLHGKYGVEIGKMSVRRDTSHSWVRISHGSNKFVMNLNNNETEIPEDQLGEHSLKPNAKYFAY